MSKKNNEFPGIDKLLADYKEKMPKTAYLLKNKERYAEIMAAIDQIIAYVVSISPDAKIEIEAGKMDTRAIYLTITTDEIIIQDIKGFCDALLNGDNMEIYPAKGDKLVMSILFNGAYSAAPAYEEIHNPFPEFPVDKKEDK